jgi:lipopolysaccharide transport system permease protein
MSNSQQPIANNPSAPAETWDLIIQPHDSLLHLHLDDLWRYRDLIFLFVRRDFVAQFKQTILGPAWFVIQPLLTTVMFTIVFGTIAQLSTDGLPKIMFYLSGNIMWQYFSACLTQTSNTFAGNAHLFGKVYFPRLVVPLSVVISAFLRFGLQFIIFMVFWTHYKMSGSSIHFTAHCLLFPFLILLMAGISLGLGIIFSSLTTKYRDLTNLLGFGVQLLMYATPVIYPLSAMPQKWKWFILANPMTSIIETFRYGFLGIGSFSWGYLAYSFAFMIVVLFLGIIIFNRVEKTFMDTV